MRSTAIPGLRMTGVESQPSAFFSNSEPKEVDYLPPKAGRVAQLGRALVKARGQWFESTPNGRSLQTCSHPLFTNSEPDGCWLSLNGKALILHIGNSRFDSG